MLQRCHSTNANPAKQCINKCKEILLWCPSASRQAMTLTKNAPPDEILPKNKFTNTNTVKETSSTLFDYPVKRLRKNVQKSSSNASAQVSKPWPMRLQMKHLPRALGQTLLSQSLLTHRYSALQTLYYSANHLLLSLRSTSTTRLTHLISLSLHRRSNLYGAAQPPWKQWSVIDCSTVLARFPLLWARGLIRLK